MKTLDQAKKLFLQVAEFAGERQEVIGGYTVTESAAKLPFMSEDEFKELQKSIEQHGLQEKIELNDEDKIVDGRNRMLACLACDIEPEFEYKSNFLEEADEVEVKNLRRRHLSAGIRASMYLKIHGLPVEDSEEMQDLEVESALVPKAVSESPAKATEPPAAKAEKKPQKTRAEAAREAGVSVRAMQQATNVVKHAVPEIAEAVASGVIPLATGEAVSTLPDEEQLEVVSSKQEAQIARDAKKKEKEVRNQANWKTFDLTKWMPSFDTKVSKMLDAVPPDLRDRCHRHMAESLGSTVRVEKDTEDMLNAASIVGYVEEVIARLPKSERSTCELAIAERYSSVVRATNSESALTAIETILAGLSESQKKKTEIALRKQYSPIEKADAKPARKTKAKGSTADADTAKKA